MALQMCLQIVLYATLFAAASSLPSLDPSAYSSDSVIRRDVCVIGGGATGTYSAIRLHDEGKSVAVIEIKDRLGGHTETYLDPTTKATVDYGVEVWHNITVVTDFFARFAIPLTTASFSIPGQVSDYVDFRTGEVVAGYTPGNPSAGLEVYGAQLAQYPYLEAGFNLPNPVPADLLLPFGDFVEKYSLESAVVTIFSFAQGLGNLLHQSTLYVLKNFGLSILENLQTNGFVTTANHDNSELYQAAQTVLGKDVFLQSRVVAMDRSGAEVKVLIRTPAGLKLIVANKLVITIPPKLDNLQGFDLDLSERVLFGQFRNSAYYTGLLRTTGIPANVEIVDTGAKTLYNLPQLPGLYYIGPTGIPGLSSFKYGSADALPDAQVKADIIASVKRLGAAGTFQTTTPEFAVFSSHTPFELTVSPQAIAAGFYQKLYALQGQRHTYYTGAAFDTHDSSLLWQFTEALLPKIAT